MKDRRKCISLKVDERYFTKVDDYAYSKRMNKADVVRAALNEYMRNHPIKQ